MMFGDWKLFKVFALSWNADAMLRNWKLWERSIFWAYEEIYRNKQSSEQTCHTGAYINHEDTWWHDMHVLRNCQYLFDEIRLIDSGCLRNNPIRILKAEPPKMEKNFTEGWCTVYSVLALLGKDTFLPLFGSLLHVKFNSFELSREISHSSEKRPLMIIVRVFRFDWRWSSSSEKNIPACQFPCRLLMLCACLPRTLFWPHPTSIPVLS